MMSHDLVPSLEIIQSFQKINSRNHKTTCICWVAYGCLSSGSSFNNFVVAEYLFFTSYWNLVSWTRSVSSEFKWLFQPFLILFILLLYYCHFLKSEFSMSYEIRLFRCIPFFVYYRACFKCFQFKMVRDSIKCHSRPTWEKWVLRKKLNFIFYFLLFSV